MKVTKKQFVSIYPEYKNLRKNDIIQFNVLFNDWERTQQYQTKYLKYKNNSNYMQLITHRDKLNNL